MRLIGYINGRTKWRKWAARERERERENRKKNPFLLLDRNFRVFTQFRRPVHFFSLLGRRFRLKLFGTGARKDDKKERNKKSAINIGAINMVDQEAGEWMADLRGSVDYMDSESIGAISPIKYDPRRRRRRRRKSISDRAAEDLAHRSRS